MTHFVLKNYGELVMNDKASSTKNFIRGGQITLHNLRMFNQIATRVFLVGIVSFLLFMFAWFFIRTTSYERYIFTQWIWAHLSIFFNGSQAKQHIDQPNGQAALVYSKSLIESNLMSLYLSKIGSVLLSGFLVCLTLCVSSIAGVIVFLKKRGRTHTKNNRIKGDYLQDANQVKAQIVKTNKNSDLVLGKSKLPIIKNTEKQHFLIDGTTGAGKSTAIKELLDQIRSRGDRVIFWDEGGNYISEFYDKSHDKIMNDLDDRGLSWHLWDECFDIADFENMATALIPMTNVQDPFWVLGARTIFSEVAFTMRNDPNRNVQALLKTLLTASLDNIKSYLEDTYASILVSDKIEKTAISIKSIMAAYLKCLRYVKDEADPFSIRRWIQDDSSSGWLFFSSLEKKHEALKPLITARLDIAINELLSLERNDNRRIWIILDELTSLHKIPTLYKILSKGRKPGACVVIGIQNYAQLAEVYGNNGAKIISSLLNTRFMFRQPDPDMAAWSARNLGESIIEEVREGISYGANTMRDGISINRQETKKAVVSSSEMMTLNDLHCFVRLPGEYPITRLEFDLRNIDSMHPAFIQRVFNDEKHKELDKFIAMHDKPGIFSSENIPEGSQTNVTKHKSGHDENFIKSKGKNIHQPEKESLFEV